MRKLLTNAPADRAWRRRGFLVLCRAHYPGGRVQLGHWSVHDHDNGIAKRTRSRAGPSRAEAEWAGVASMLMGVGADPISLMGDGADISSRRSLDICDCGETTSIECTTMAWCMRAWHAIGQQHIAHLFLDPLRLCVACCLSFAYTSRRWQISLVFRLICIRGINK